MNGEATGRLKYSSERLSSKPIRLASERRPSPDRLNPVFKKTKAVGGGVHSAVKVRAGHHNRRDLWGFVATNQLPEKRPPTAKRSPALIKSAPLDLTLSRNKNLFAFSV